MVSPERAARPLLVDLTVGQPAVDVLPLEQLAEAARQALPGNPKSMLYTHTEGADELIDIVRAKLRYLRRARDRPGSDRDHQWLRSGH